MEVKRRTQADRSAATRAALIAAARPLFAAHGFGNVATATIVRDAGVTRGALYHQFSDKTELFAAVFEDVEVQVATAIGEAVAASGAQDPLSALTIGADAWLDVCTDPVVHRIVLIEAPSVLGWERWREIGMRYGLGLVEGILAQGIASGDIPAQPTRPLAHILIGAIDEAALYVARSADPVAARDEVRAVVRRLIAAVAQP